MTKLENFKQQFFRDLKDKYPENELEIMYDLLIDKYLKIPEAQDKQENFVLQEFQQQQLEEALGRLKKDEPIQ